jgi:hypothetical protein
MQANDIEWPCGACHATGAAGHADDHLRPGQRVFLAMMWRKQIRAARALRPR